MGDTYGAGFAAHKARRPARGKRIDMHDAGEDVMKGYVSHARPIDAQREYVRQVARKRGGEDRALLLEMLLGETTEQTAQTYADALGDPNLRELLVDALAEPRLRRNLGILGYDVDELRGRRRGSGRGMSADLVVVDEAADFLGRAA